LLSEEDLVANPRSDNDSCIKGTCKTATQEKPNSLAISTLKNDGAQRRIRTTDTRIFSPLLYQLSYLGLFRQTKSRTPDFIKAP
jgi:hypothetical protein